MTIAMLENGRTDEAILRHVEELARRAVGFRHHRSAQTPSLASRERTGVEA